MSRAALSTIVLVLLLLCLPLSGHSNTFDVNSFADAVDANLGNGVCATAGGVCTLRAAIQETNALAAGAPHTINLPAGTYTLTIPGTGETGAVTGDLGITRTGLTITGSGQGTTIIDGGALDRVFIMGAGISVSMSNLTVRNGSPGAIGGGIRSNSGTLTLTRVTVTGNTTGASQGGGVYSSGNLVFTDVVVSNNTGSGGGGIYCTGTITYNGGTVSGNTGTSGGGLQLGNSSTLTNVTVSGNTGTTGGGIYIGGGNTLNLTNVTIYGNITGMGVDKGSGGAATTSFKNTIIAGNAAGNCSQAFTSAGYNLESTTNTCGFTGTGDQNSVTAGNLNIGALASNGGPTQTHALLAGSFAINTGTSTGAPATDQRGVARPQGAGYDVGAYEYQPPNNCPGNVVTTTADSGNNSLRECIITANNNPGTTISFNIPGPGNQSSGGNSWWRISPASVLPTITANGTVIDGTTQTTNQGNTNTLGPEIEIDGSSVVPVSSQGFYLTSSNNRIKGFIINNFKTAASAAVRISGASASSNIITGCYLGTNYSGTAVVGNIMGVYLHSGASSNTIGGTTAAERNIISGNSQYGIRIDDAGSNSNTIMGNYIGTDSSGTSAFYVGSGGVYISTGPQSNTIGGDTADRRNIISGHNNTGVGISDANLNVVKGNYIGTDVNGLVSLSNNTAGVYLTTNATSNTIGGSTAGQGNLISGNTGYGVMITAIAGGTNSNIVKGNRIGTSADGTTALPNGSNGVQLMNGVQLNVIGGTGANEGNVIAFNGGAGVNVDGASTDKNTISGNAIFSNTGLGIDLAPVGVGTGGGANNDKARPTLTAVVKSGANWNVTATVIAGDTIEFFRVNNSAAPAVSADGSGSGEGYLYLGKCVDNGGAGSCSGPYMSSTADGNAAAGTVQLTLLGTGLANGDYLTATATDATNGTSEFSANALADLSCTVTNTSDVGAGSLRQCITNANASPGMTIKFNIPGPGNQSFGGDSWWRISPGSALPIISANGTIIDGTTQTTSQGNTNSLGPEIEIDGSSAGAVHGLDMSASNSTIKGLIVNGFNVDPKAGVIISGNSNTVSGNYLGTNYKGTSAPAVTPNKRGVQIMGGGQSNIIGGTTAADRNIISGNSNFGVVIQQVNTNLNQVKGNYIGVGPDGSTTVGNQAGGVLIEQSAAQNTIGGSTVNDRNIISGNTGYGIGLLGEASDGNIIKGNHIGTDSTGTVDVGNTTSGIILSEGDSTVVGGTTADERNVISGNNAYGILIYFNSNNNTLYGNYIGTQADGISALGNGSVGIYILANASGSSTGNIIGGTAAGQGNVIAYNTNAGIYLDETANSADNNQISGNSIFLNTGLGIDLGPLGVGSTNGANNNKARPTITSITPSGANFSVVATVTASDTIEFFRANNAAAPAVSADGSGSGEGFLYLGKCVDNGACSGPHINAVADANAAAGTVQATLLSSGLSAGDTVTATASDATNGTSEFAANVTIIAVSGTVYTDEGSTNIGPGKTVRLIRNGADAGSSTTNASGQYSISTAPLNAGDAFLVYIDGDATKGATVTVSNGSNLSGLNLYAGHVITRHDNAGALSNANMSTALGAYSDADILYSVSGGNLTVSGATTELYVPTGHTYTPGGNVATSHVKVIGTMNGGANTFTVSGDWDSSNGTWWPQTSTVNLTGTGTLAQYTAATPWSYGFNNLSLAATGKTTTLTSNQLWVGQLTTGSGTLTDGPASYTVVLQGVGNVFVDGGGPLTMYGFQYRAGEYTQNVVGRDYTGITDMRFNTVGGPTGSGIYNMQGNLVANDLYIEINNSAGNARNSVLNTNNYSLTASNLYVGRNGDTKHFALLNAGSSSMDINGDVVIYPSDANGDNVINAASSTWTVSGNWTNSDIFTPGTSTITLDGTNQSITGNSTFNNLTKSVATARTLTFAAGSTTTVNGTCTLNGASGQLLALRSSSSPTKWNFVLGASSTKAISYVDVKDSDASGSDAAKKPIGPANSVDSGNTVAWFAFLVDALIKLSSEGDGAYLSDNVYEASATTQLKNQGVVSGTAAQYNVRFQNDSASADSIVVTGTATGSNFTVQYLDDTATDRTAAVIGAGYTIAGLAAGANKVWTLNVTPNGGGTPVAGGTSYNVLVTATSGGDATKTDQVKAVTSSTSANITLLKSADRGTAKPGDEIAYTTTGTNAAGLTSASAIVMRDPVPANTGFKIGGASFNAGTSTLTCAYSYSSNNGTSWVYSPVSGGCSAPAGYDYCVTDVRWTMTGSMPTNTSFSVGMVARVK